MFSQQKTYLAASFAHLRPSRLSNGEVDGERGDRQYTMVCFHLGVHHHTGKVCLCFAVAHG